MASDFLRSVSIDADHWSSALEISYLSLIDEVGLIEQFSSDQRYKLLDIAAAIPLKILQTAITGSIPRTFHTEEQVKAFTKSARHQAANAPSIYSQYLVNESNNESPSPIQLRKVIEAIRLYCTLDEESAHLFAYDVDSIKFSGTALKARSRRGFRKYFEQKSDRFGESVDEPSSTKRSKTLDFCDALEHRLDGMPEEQQGEPLTIPLVEIGYTARVEQRLQQHSSHQSSNYIMNLVEAISQHLYNSGDLTRLYRMKQFVLYNIWESEQAALAEIFFTHVSHGYTDNGGGFSHYPAGLSNQSANSGNTAFWKSLEQKMLVNTPYLDNMAEEFERIKKAMTAGVTFIAIERAAIDLVIELVE